jgi:chemosensory pili system protein ChpA (sensor histidine kinase/response regulator)
LDAPVIEEATAASAPKEIKPFTSVDRYLVSQQRAEYGPTGVDNYISALNTPVDEITPTIDIEAEPETSMEDQLLNIFSQEAAEHIETLKTSLADIAFSRQINKTMLRAIHSLKGCANIAGVHAIAELATSLDQVMKTIHSQDLVMDSEQMTLLSHAVSGLEDILAMIIEDHITPDIDGLQASIAALMPQNSDAETSVIDPEFLMVFLEETDELLDAYTNQLSHWLAHPWDEGNLGALITTISKLEEVAD